MTEQPGVILGTAGHIDHGKTALVRALTGVDTDRLKEEKERGITIELGFAQLAVGGRRRFGVVDVPGHEAFVRAMVAGAAGMDVVLLVVAADEGVMPQTREHLAIVELLDVPELVVAVTKCDVVDAEWLDLVDGDVAALLARTRYAQAPLVHTSAVVGTGLDALVGALADAADRVSAPPDDDLVRLPLDRVFTIQGTGTVATGTLWSGRLSVGDRVRILPQDLEARVRALQVHDQDVEAASAGERTAVALAGEGADRALVARGATLVTSPAWAPTWMLTARVRLLSDSSWMLAHNQRVHVHHGTAEVLARCALLQDDEVAPGERGWLQLRLEEPLAVRARDHLVIRAYSPVSTIGGGEVAEAAPPKRNRLDDATRTALDRILDGSVAEAVEAHLELQGWQGRDPRELPVHVGAPPGAVEEALREVEARGSFRTSRALYAASVRSEGEARILAAVEAGHAEDALRPAVPLAAVRSALPRWAPAELPDALVSALVAGGRLEDEEGGVRLPGHRPTLSADQRTASERLVGLLVEAGLGAPAVEELPEELRSRADLWSLLRRLETEGLVRPIADGVYLSSEELEGAASRIREALGGRKGLGPADFRDTLPVSRKRLIPLLNYFDGLGVTVRSADGRDVPANP
ncbi:MAG TPA: selenocysteine-specific translation elongation factor [Longimicrobiales bacterium]|nr:selenocysteine-specific translation elongation factor [Longimicrobiales bacterium]